MLRIVVVALGLAIAGVAHAADEPEDLLVYASRGTEAERRAVNVARLAALPAGAPSTTVTLSCVAGKVTLSECKTVSMNPPHGREDVALAAAKFAQSQRFAERDRNGAVVEGRRFEVIWDLPAPGDKNPDWLRKPTAETIAGVFPVRAMKEGKSGTGVITCKVTVNGFLDRCKVVSESPEEYGFGAAALILSKQFAMTPAIRSGQPVEGDVRIPITFKIPVASSVSSERLLTDPPWAKTPSPAQVAAAYPKRAMDLPSGQAALRCGLTKTGATTACSVVSEIPPAKGFGAAAKGLAPNFVLQFRPEDVAMLKDISVDIPFRFRNPTAPDNRRLTEPTWLVTLSAAGAAQIYPKAARDADVMTGAGYVDCAATAQGGLTDCRVTREDPVDKGFGAAAVEAAKHLKMNPWTKGGDPVEGRRLLLPIRLKLEDPAPAAKPGGG